MLDYKIHKLTYKELGDRFPHIDVGGRYIPSYIYVGFWEDIYIGYMAGVTFSIDTIDIQCTMLVPEYRGTKVVRILKEILKTIHKDFDIIHTRVDSQNNNMLMVLLRAGFHVIGFRGDCVELERIKLDG